MNLIKASLAWIAIGALFGWGILKAVHPDNPTWTPLFLVIIGFIVTVGATGCRVDEVEH